MGKANKSLKAWVAFVKSVQKKYKLTYKDAIHKAKELKDKGADWMNKSFKSMKGGDDSESVDSEGMDEVMGEGMDEGTGEGMDEGMSGGRRHGRKRRMTRKRRGSRSRSKSRSKGRSRSFRRSMSRRRASSRKASRSLGLVMGVA